MNEKLKRNKEADQVELLKLEHEELLQLLNEVKNENGLLRCTNKKVIKRQEKYRKHLEILYHRVGKEKCKVLIKEELLMELTEKTNWDVMKIKYLEKIDKLEDKLRKLQEGSQKSYGSGYWYGTTLANYVSEVLQVVKPKYPKCVLKCSYYLSRYQCQLQGYVKPIYYYLWGRFFS